MLTYGEGKGKELAASANFSWPLALTRNRSLLENFIQVRPRTCGKAYAHRDG